MKIINHLNNSKGFTLAELMTAAAILAILSTAGFSFSLNHLPDYRLKNAANELYLNIRLAKAQAIKENREWAIIFDVANNRYCICSDPGVDSWGNYGGSINEQADMTCAGDNTIEQLVNLSSYGSGVKFGHGAATKEATTIGAPFTNDNPTTNVRYTANGDIATFNSRGRGNSGYIYLSHNKDFKTYAIGTGVGGVVYLKQWLGNGWD